MTWQAGLAWFASLVGVGLILEGMVREKIAEYQNRPEKETSAAIGCRGRPNCPTRFGGQDV